MLKSYLFNLIGCEYGKKINTTESSGKYDFVGKVGFFTGFSILLVVLSFVYLAIHGISYGIDFKGGTGVPSTF